MNVFSGKPWECIKRDYDFHSYDHKTEQLLRSRGIEYYIEQTQRAIGMFNDLIKQGKKVGGLFHSTC
jgi:hypothetical protein